ncbi:MAG: YidC/Oxa1 family membrane protein insertase [Candidatus Saccharimonadaceae bacterium]
MFDTLVVQPIFNLLIGLYSIIPGGDFGVTIIIFTILVRFAMYPLIKKQLHQTKIMRKIQPELARIKKQAKGNKQLEGMMMMELYKKNDISPFRSIGILLIQLPIFIALFSVIQIFTQHRDQIAKFAYDFMEGIGPIKSLIDNPSGFNEKLFGIVDLTAPAISSHGVDIFLLLLAIISAYTQYVMSKQTMPTVSNKKKFSEIMKDAGAGKDVDQSEMNAVMMGNMTKILPVMMLFIMLSVPGALALYYAVSNIVAVIQQDHLLKQDETELEAMADKDVAKKAPKTTVNKKSTAKKRAEVAKEATVTRIIAKDTRKGK